MHISRFNIIVSATIALFFGGCLPAFSQTNAPDKPAAIPASTRPADEKPKASNVAHAYLFRGLMNIFSLGMDDLAEKLQHSGVPSSVHEYGSWEAVSNQIAARYHAGDRGAIILIGHSLGADVVMMAGEYLGTKGVPVTLIVPFDATKTFAASSNVQRVMNITQRDYAYMTRGTGFRGELQNIDVSRYEEIGHTNIDKMPRLHAMVVNKALAVSKLGAGEMRTNTAAGAKPKKNSTTAKPVSAHQDAVESKPEPITGASATVETGLSTNKQPASHIKPSASESSATNASSSSNNLSPVIPSASPPAAAKEPGSSVSTPYAPKGSPVFVAPGSTPAATRGALEYQQLR